MADTLDLLTLAEGKTAINISTTDHDTELAMQITAVSRIIDEQVGPVVQRTITAEVHPPGPVVTRYAPIVSVSLVRELVGTAATTRASVAWGGTTEGYYLDPSLNGRIYYTSGGTLSDWSNGLVEVTYVAGRYATTVAVDARFKSCAGAVLRRLWKREAGTWAQSADFFESIDSNDTSSIGFYRVARPIIDEMLGDQRPVLVG